MKPSSPTIRRAIARSLQKEEPAWWAAASKDNRRQRVSSVVEEYVEEYARVRRLRATFVLDGSAPSDADASARLEILQVFRQFGIPVNRLVADLMRDRERRLLVLEQKATDRDRRNRNTGRVSALIGAALRLVDPDSSLEEKLEDAFNEAEGILQVQWQRPVDDVKSPHSAELVAGYASQRRAVKRRCARTEIAPGADLVAVQTRVMPRLRRVVWSSVKRALAERVHTQETYRHYNVRTENDGGLADVLTARFIKAFFPSWGATTDADVVRKARSRSASNAQ